jgi:putative lipoic acid-binding regulatory protein
MSDSKPPDDALLEFPCRFPIKVVGRATEGFEEFVVAIVERHAGRDEEIVVKSRLSRDGNYVAVTCAFLADSRAQVDGLYAELSGHDRILMVL